MEHLGHIQDRPSYLPVVLSRPGQALGEGDKKYVREVRARGRVLNRPCRKSGHGRLSQGWRQLLGLLSRRRGGGVWVEVDPDGEEVRRAGLEAVLLSCQRTLLGQ